MQKQTTIIAGGIMAETLTDDMKTTWKSARAGKKFNQLDADNSGNLEHGELGELAEWVWGSFNPKEKITEALKTAEIAKIIAACDKNNDGKIDKEEFATYYENVCKEMADFHKEKNAKIAAEKKAAAAKAKEEAKALKAKAHEEHMAK